MRAATIGFRLSQLAVVAMLFNVPLPARALDRAPLDRLRVEIRPVERRSVWRSLASLPQLLKLSAGGITRPRPGTTYRVAAVAYSSTVSQTDLTPCITAAGTTVRRGIVATNFLPLGTRLRVGNKLYVVEDRMNARYNGKYVIDIWHPTRSLAQEFGKRILEIEILGYIPQAELKKAPAERGAHAEPRTLFAMLTRLLTARLLIPREADCLITD